MQLFCSYRIGLSRTLCCAVAGRLNRQPGLTSSRDPQFSQRCRPLRLSHAQRRCWPGTLSFHYRYRSYTPPNPAVWWWSHRFDSIRSFFIRSIDRSVCCHFIHSYGLLDTRLYGLIGCVYIWSKTTGLHAESRAYANDQCACTFFRGRDGSAIRYVSTQYTLTGLLRPSAQRGRHDSRGFICTRPAGS